MKKIIYSLVIMIAAGSLFTSCIEPVEPVGIFDLREAKARYYDALSKLRAADAEKVLAEADLVKAQAEMKRAKVEYQNLLNEEQRLFNEATALGNEKEAAKWAMKIEELKKDHELKMIEYEQKIAEAQETLRQALSKIQMAALDLTDAEKKALTKAIDRYEKKLAKYQAAQEKVLKAEAKLWSAQYDLENAKDDIAPALGISGMSYPFFFDYSAIRMGMDYGEYLELVLAYVNAFAEATYAEFEDALDNHELADWAAELEGLKAELDQVKHDRYQVTKDSVLYMNTVFCDGNTEFELAVKAWMEEHPAVADPGKKPAAPKESDYKAADYQADSIAFPQYEFNLANAADAKLLSLLSSYMTDADGVHTFVGDSTQVVIKKDTKTLTIIANQSMKDFVLGTATSTTGSQVIEYKDKDGNKQKMTADYGLNGALSVLKRELVLKKGIIKTKEQLEKELKEAKDQWQADRDTLLAFYEAVAKAEKDTKVDPYEAYEPIAAAKKALNDAKDEAKKESGSLVAATEKVVERINKAIWNNTKPSYYDSTELVDAFVEFAKTRAAYLEYTPYKTSPAVEWDNKDLFYFAKSTDPRVIDSVEFVAQKYNDFIADSRYSYDLSTPTPKKDATADGLGLAAYVRVAEQLLGANAAAALLKLGTTTASDLLAPEDINDGAFYDPLVYKYVPKAGDKAAYIAVSEDGGSSWKEYVPSEIGEAEAALADAVTEFNNCFERFWGVNPGADGKDFTMFKKGGTYEKYNPAVYTAETFTEPYNVITFDDGGDVVWTAAVGAILGSVDPAATTDNATELKTGDKVDKTKSAIFFDNATDFYNYMYAAWALDNEDLEEAIAKIEKWIADVTAAFEKDVTDAEAAAKKAYEKAVKDNDKAVEKWQKSKDQYDEYMTALKAFVGVDEDDEPINVKKVDGKLVPAITKIAEPVDYETAAVEQKLVGPQTYSGEWIFGGEQAKLAEQYLPQFPELLAEWRSTAAETDHQIMHLEAIIDTLEKAYLAAVQNDDPDIETIEDYFEDYLEDLYMQYESYLAMASILEKAIAQYEAGYSEQQIALEALQHALELAQQELKDAEIELEAAKVYYDKVLAATVGKN